MPQHYRHVSLIKDGKLPSTLCFYKLKTARSATTPPRPPTCMFTHKSWDGLWVNLLALSSDKGKHFPQQLPNEKEIKSVSC